MIFLVKEISPSFLLERWGGARLFLFLYFLVEGWGGSGFNMFYGRAPPRLWLCVLVVLCIFGAFEL